MLCVAELQDALDEIETDRNIGSIVITGSERAFAGNHKESLLFTSRKTFAKKIEICHHHHHQLWRATVIIIIFVNVVTMSVIAIPLVFAFLLIAIAIIGA